MHKRYLALDLAGRFGYAIGSFDRVEASGSILIPKGEIEDRFAWLFRWLETFCEEHRPDEIIFEKPMIKPTDDLHVVRLLSGFCCTAGLFASLNGYPVSEAEVRTVRKYFLGKVPHGRPEQKKAVMKMCRVRGWSPRDDNAGDALALLDFMIAHTQASSLIHKSIQIQPCGKSPTRLSTVGKG